MRVILREALEDEKIRNKNEFIYDVVDVWESDYSFLLADYKGRFFKDSIENYVMLREENSIWDVRPSSMMWKKFC